MQSLRQFHAPQQVIRSWIPAAPASKLGRKSPRDSRKTSVTAQPMSFVDPRLAALDGFRVEIDTAGERADVILDRPPLNVVSMPQRDQLRLVFERLDEESSVRVIVLRAVGEHFS